MCEIEATLNCRPITKLSSNVEDLCAMLPLSILNDNLNPDSPVHESNKSDLYICNDKYVVAVSEQIWNRWIQMYVPWLQIRHRWHEIQPNVKKNDLFC